MKSTSAIALLILVATVPLLHAHDETTPNTSTNVWNRAQEPTNWWNEIKQAHGHVGPWNVLGWRMGKAALRELNASWGRHELDIVCHIPMKTPYSCVADGLVVGTGNSIGRLDIRLAEALAMSDTYVSVRRKDGHGPVILLKPNIKYLEQIRRASDAQLESLAHACGELPEKDLFVVERIERPDQDSKQPTD